MQTIKQDKINIGKIVAALKNGAVLVCPTDTVYGLVCDASNEKSVEKIFEIKKRDKSKPLGIFVKDIKAAKKLAFADKNQESFLKDNEITAILKAKKPVLSELVYKNKTIGIRIPNYKFLNLILEKFNKPLVQTSANISGKETTVKIKNILKQFKTQEVIIVDGGDLPKNKPSTIIDLTNNNINILRK